VFCHVLVLHMPIRHSRFAIVSLPYEPVRHMPVSHSRFAICASTTNYIRNYKLVMVTLGYKLIERSSLYWLIWQTSCGELANGEPFMAKWKMVKRHHIL